MFSRITTHWVLSWNQSLRCGDLSCEILLPVTRKMQRIAIIPCCRTVETTSTPAMMARRGSWPDFTLHILSAMCTRRSEEKSICKSSQRRAVASLWLCKLTRNSRVIWFRISLICEGPVFMWPLKCPSAWGPPERREKRCRKGKVDFAEKRAITGCCGCKRDIIEFDGAD